MKVDKTKSISERIAFLRECCDKYETTGTSPISDAEYDKEYYELQAIAPTDPFFSEVGGLNVEQIFGEIVKHEITMGSLLKCRDEEETLKWLKSLYGTGIHTFVIQYKMDGAALSCIYKGGKLVQALTRGNGYEGVDVTEHAKVIRGIPQAIKCQDEVEVRGEVFVDKNEFFKKWHESVGGKYKNPRNFTAGCLNLQDIEKVKERNLKFVAYEILRMEMATEVDKVKFLMDNGFSNFRKSSRKVEGDYKTVARAIKKFMDGVDRAALPFDIDGVVVKLNDVKAAKAMGTVSGGKKPKANRAVKFPPEQKESHIIDIEFSVGRTGAITPVGIIEPVDLAGTTVQRVNLHNFKEMERMGLSKIGARVLMEKAGDIIPQVAEVKQDGDGKAIGVPDECPMCKSILEWDDTQTTKWCSNIRCQSQVNSGIEHWFKTIGVKGIGPGIISRLTEEPADPDIAPAVVYLADMYSLAERAEAYKLEEMFGKRAFANIVKAIDSVKEIPLDLFIRGLGFSHIGSSSSEIAAVAPSLEALDKLTVADLEKLDAFGERKARSFVEGWKTARSEVDALLKHVSIKADTQTSDKLAGKKFCFTGSFSNPKRSDMERLVVEHGGKCGSVSKDLTGLVWDGEISGSKIDKAKKLGLPILSQEDFMGMIS